MPRENSFSDSSGRSLTPDLEDEANFPEIQQIPASPQPSTSHSKMPPPEPPLSARSVAARSVHTHRSKTPGDRFRASVRKVMAMHRTSSVINNRRAGAEPGVDPRRESAILQFGHIHQNCVIELCDYSSVRHSFGRMTNVEFVRLLQDPKAHQREPWAKVRWINIGGISWDVISALALRHGTRLPAVEVEPTLSAYS